MKNVAHRLNVSVEDLDLSLWADYENELILRHFSETSPEDLLKMYNLSLCQTLLLKAIEMKLSVKGSSSYKEILRSVKWLGLMYTPERKDDGKVCVSIEGALTLFKLTERYGNAIAKLLPMIVSEDGWEIEADIVKKYDGKTHLNIASFPLFKYLLRLLEL
ncbi:MAG: DUF790 family protein [Candidatus Syntrophoarchaeum sp.]|nr:DUF790 family protein [Methanomicrobia archaeon]MBL7117822.1 DUF790 family protein [Candidatus Syntrophoarchaeum sp.]